MSNPRREGREHFVYWMFDENGQCLYVGMTRKPEQRWKQHQCENSHWIERVAYKRMAGPFERGNAFNLERQEQEHWQPVYDVRQRNAREWRQRQAAPRWTPPSRLAKVGIGVDA